MQNLYYLLLFYVFYRAVRGLCRVNSSLNWIIKSSKKLYSKPKLRTTFIHYILIPVLREQELIKQTFKTFANLKGSYRLVFITTEREIYDRKFIKVKLFNRRKKLLEAKNIESFLELTNGIFPKSVAINIYKKPWSIFIKEFNNLPTTEKILQILLSKSPKNIRQKVSIYRFPENNKNMSDQLNYAIKRISKLENLSNVYISIYNADSNITQGFPLFIDNFINLNPHAKVIQQSALFLSNYNDLSNTFFGSLLKSISLLQSRWTLAHELPRILFQCKSKVFGFLECAHVVGHGLTIKLDTLIKAGGFPTEYINEDLPFGYILKLHGNTIYPFPLLENGHSPSTIRGMFTQYKTWFYGALSYPLYTLHAWNKFKKNRNQVLVWGVIGFLRSLLWLSSSFVWIFLFLYPFLTNNYYLLATTIVFCTYAPLSFVLMEHKLNKFSTKIFGDGIYVHSTINLQTYLASFVAYITHSYGPILATINLLKSFVTKSKIKKQKTER